MRYAELSEVERLSVEHILTTTTSEQTRKRCNCILLSAKQMSMEQVSTEADVSWSTVSRLVNKWNASSGYRASLLKVAKGRGRKPKLTELPMVTIISRLLKAHSGNIRTVLVDLDVIHNTKVCEKTLRRFIGDHNL